VRNFAAPSARLRVSLLGYEGNLGADAVQENPTKPPKIQQIGAFELVGFGSCCSEFRHRKGIGMLRAEAGQDRSVASRLHKARNELGRVSMHGAVCFEVIGMDRFCQTPPANAFLRPASTNASQKGSSNRFTILLASARAARAIKSATCRLKIISALTGSTMKNVLERLVAAELKRVAPASLRSKKS
jgi:hypothetical protein